MMTLIDQFKLMKNTQECYIIALFIWFILHVIFDNKILNVCFCITSYGRVYTTDPYHALAPAAAYGVGAMVRILTCLQQNISSFFGDFNEAMCNFLHVIMKNCMCEALW